MKGKGLYSVLSTHISKYLTKINFLMPYSPLFILMTCSWTYAGWIAKRTFNNL